MQVHSWGSDKRDCTAHSGLLPAKASPNPRTRFYRLPKGGSQEKGKLPPASSKGLIHYCKGFKTEVKKSPGNSRVRKESFSPLG